MKDQTSRAKLQHFVPQFLLKYFSMPGTDQLFVFDKQHDRIFKAHTRKVAAETGFYDAKLPEGLVSAEAALSNLESAAGGVIRKILLDQNLKELTQDEKVVLALFIGIQMLRVPHQIDIMVQMTEMIRNKWGNLPGMPVSETDSLKEAKQTIVASLSGAIEFLPDILNKSWLLLRAHHGSCFYICDNPVTMHNAHRSPLRGTLGFAVKGIEVYLPLSAQITLGLFCPSHEERWAALEARRAAAVTARTVAASDLVAKNEVVESIVGALKTGRPLQLSEQITHFQNELQVWNSSRFIYSNNRDFELAKDITHRYAASKSAPRLSGG